MTNDVAVYRRARPDEEPDALFYPGHRGKPHAGLLNGPGPDGPRTVEEFYGGATLALWRGVTPGAVTKWFSRHPGRMPAEDARLLNADGTGYERYYRASREAEWREVAPGPGRGAPGKPKPRGADADARRGAAWLDSTEPDKRGRIHVRDVAALLPLRAVVPYGPRKTVRGALDAAPGRIVLSASDDPAVMWLWAADQEAAEAAAEAMPGLLFAPHA